MEKVVGVIILFIIGFGLRYLMRMLMRGAFNLTGNAVRKIANKENNNREDQNDSDKPAARYIDWDGGNRSNDTGIKSLLSKL